MIQLPRLLEHVSLLCGYKHIQILIFAIINLKGTRGNISVMVSQIKKAFEERLSMNGFLDPVTKQRSIWKV